jgi:phage shock protein C
VSLLIVFGQRKRAQRAGEGGSGGRDGVVGGVARLNAGRPTAERACGDAETRNDGAMSNNYNGKTLVRTRDDRIVAGVCSGLARYFEVDVNVVRLVAVLITLFTVGTGILAYLVAWAVIPEEGQKTSMAEDLINKNRMN